MRSPFRAGRAPTASPQMSVRTAKLKAQRGRLLRNSSGPDHLKRVGRSRESPFVLIFRCKQGHCAVDEDWGQKEIPDKDLVIVLRGSTVFPSLIQTSRTSRALDSQICICV